MADFSAYPHRVNEPELLLLVGKITAAADVDANGYTVTGNGFLTVAKSAEGIALITLSDVWPSFWGMSAQLSIDDYTVTLDSEDVDGAKTITATFRKQSADASADTDPDGATIYVQVYVKNTDV